MNTCIPPQRYEFSSEDVDFIVSRFRQILEQRAFLTMGRYCEEFEKAFAAYVGCRYAVAVSSGTAALEAIFRAMDVRGWDVIVPTNTFAATVFAVIAAGGWPVFADCCDDLTIDPEDVKRRLTARTKAVVTVHIGGLVSPRTRELLDFCKAKGLYLVEDAAHAHGSMLDGRHAGTFGIAAAFSFFPTKVMTTGEGGMVVTDDDKIAEKVRILRDQGKVPGKGNYHEEFGYNWRMTEVAALMGLAQLRRLEEFVARRRQIARIYDEGLAGANGVRPLRVPPEVRHNYYKYVVFVHGIDREALRHRLLNEYGISLSGYVYELPCHEQTVFRRYVETRLPVAEDLCRRHICLPIYYSLTDEQAQYVARSLAECVAAVRAGRLD